MSKYKLLDNGNIEYENAYGDIVTLDLSGAVQGSVSYNDLVYREINGYNYYGPNTGTIIATPNTPINPSPDNINYQGPFTWPNSMSPIQTSDPQEEPFLDTEDGRIGLDELKSSYKKLEKIKRELLRESNETLEEITKQLRKAIINKDKETIQRLEKPLQYFMGMQRAYLNIIGDENSYE